MRHRDGLLRYLEGRGRGLLAYESAEDLAQGVHERALASEDFEHRGEAEFVTWLRVIADRHVADRHDYWSAHKRGCGKILRLTLSGVRATDATPIPAEQQTGPATFAERREALSRIARAMAVLPERDQQLIRWRCEDVALDEQARRLGLGYDAAQRAGVRALERLRRAFALLSQGG
ncbi:MAG: hypothetical protein AAF628_19090 [Planctomycetota bacterium]